MKFVVSICLVLASLASYKIYKYTQRPLTAEQRMAAFEVIFADSDALIEQLDAALATNDAEEVARINAALEANFARIDALMQRPEPGPAAPPEYLALFDAIEDGSPGDIHALLQGGMDLNVAVGPYGSAPLHRAMMRPGRSTQVVSLLLDAGASADFATDEGYTALHFIADTNYPDDDPAEISAMITLLLANGANMEARTHWDWTPLHRAVMEGREAELEALLQNGADPNVRFSEESLPDFSRGMTPLMVAGSEDRKVALLLRFGANLLLPGASGETSFDFFKREAALAAANLAIKTEAGTAEEFDRYHSDGISRSLALIRAHVSDG